MRFKNTQEKDEREKYYSTQKACECLQNQALGSLPMPTYEKCGMPLFNYYKLHELSST